MSNLMKYLRDAVDSYAGNYDFENRRSTVGDREWLGSYLRQRLTKSSDEEVVGMVTDIMDTLALQKKKLDDLKAARRKGVSAEEWLAVEMERQKCSEEEQKAIVKETADVLRKKAGYEDEKLTQELAEIEQKKGSGLRQIAKRFASTIGVTALAAVASDEYPEAIEEASKELSEEEAQPVKRKGFFRRLLEEGAVAGLKVAISGGLTVAKAAEESELTSAPVKTLATIAHKVVEEAAVFCDVIRGKKKIGEAVRHMKDTAVATIAGVIEQERSGELGRRMAEPIGKAVGAVAGFVFGPTGAEIGAKVGGCLAQIITSEKVVGAVKKVATAAVETIAKTADVVIEKGKEIVKGVGRAVFGGLKRLITG